MIRSPHSYRWLLLAICFLVISCSALKEKNYEKDVRTFLDQFEKNLSASDEVILEQFRVDKSAKVIMKAIAVMQNKRLAEDSIRCTVNFAKPLVTLDPIESKIELLAQFQSIDPNLPMSREAKFTLWVSPAENERLFVSKIEADDFYSQYAGMTYELSSQKHRARDIASRKTILDKAEILKQLYDSVIWYTTYQDSIYYYVINGKWNNYFLRDGGEKLAAPSMGLVSESGRVVVPPEYDLVGTLGFEKEGYIEVKKDGRVGKYLIDGKQLAPAAFELLVPYTFTDSITSAPMEVLLAKNDSAYGWIAKDSTFIAGFPTSEAEEYVRTRQYLDQKIKINGTSTTMTEVLSLDHMGFGIVMPPYYLVNAGMVNEIVSSFYTGENSLGWGEIEEIETEGSLFVKIADNLSALVVLFTTRYVEGREGFYTQSQLTFLDDNDTALGQFRAGGGSLTFNRVEGTVLEMRTDPGTEDINEFAYEEGDADWELNPIRFQYFRLLGDTVVMMKSSRNFNFTEFAKLDSSYFRGQFLFYDPENGETYKRNFVSNKKIEAVRNEILANYGFIFADPEAQERWSDSRWYQPKHATYAGFLEEMSDIDRHNLLFLETLVPTLDNPSSV